jgi:hypothetical protein
VVGRVTPTGDGVGQGVIACGDILHRRRVFQP